MITSKKKVALVRYDGTFNSFQNTIELCNGFSDLKATDKILIKPNILWGGTKPFPTFGRVTTSIMVEYILKALQDRGCTDITIGEGTIPNKEMGSTTNQGFAWSGIERVAKKYGVRLVDFNSGPFEEVQLDNIKVKISKYALECDFFVNVPVLKAHRQTKVTLGMKNLKGCIDLKSKQRFHMHDINHLIALLNMKIKPSLTVIDGIYGLERGPDFLGTPHRMDLIIAGKDVFSCDVVGAMVMGMEPEDIEYLKQFALMTGRTVSLDKIDISGDSIEQVVRKMDWHLSVEDIFHQAHLNGITIQEDSTSVCSGCGAILSALTAVLVKDSPNTTLDKVEICMGSELKAKKESKKVFLLGDCAISCNKDREDAIKIEGCPPPIISSITAIATKSFPRNRALKILMSRTTKQIGTKLGIYHESFPIFGICEPPEFDEKHF